MLFRSPEMDFERVYSSDMKKMVKWFSILEKNGIEIKLSEVPEETVEDQTPAPAAEETSSEAAPAKKARKKKAE